MEWEKSSLSLLVEYYDFAKYATFLVYEPQQYEITMLN